MSEWRNQVVVGDALSRLRELPDESVHCVVTSPPYWGLRSYTTEPIAWGGDAACAHEWGAQERGKRKDILPSEESTAGRLGASEASSGASDGGRFCVRCGAWRGELGLEPSPDLYVEHLVGIFREIRRVLHQSGTVFLNLGDSYAGSGKGGIPGGVGEQGTNPGSQSVGRLYHPGATQKEAAVENATRSAWPDLGIKPKDLIGIPWMVAFALRADGWWLRSDIVWAKQNCLSGGARIYAKTQKGEMPVTLKDIVRLKPETVQLWNGNTWTQVVEWLPSKRPRRTYEIEVRSGERIGCTAEHHWPTQRGNVRTNDLRVGDVIQHSRLPEPTHPRVPSSLGDEDTGWFCGIYLAEGSRSGDTIQISGHAKEVARNARLERIAAAHDGTCLTYAVGGQSIVAHLRGTILAGILDAYVAGRVARDKHLHQRCWGRSDVFLRAFLLGYLEGDGHFDVKNNRWRIGFTNNDNFAGDLRTICARIGATISLRRVTHAIGPRKYPGYRGEIRLSRKEHWNGRAQGMVVAIRRSRARKFWDVIVADKPHLFALSSGLLTHNCMPESVRDRPTRSHEFIFLLAKRGRYYYDQDAIREPHAAKSLERYKYGVHVQKNPNALPAEERRHEEGIGDCERMEDFIDLAGRNARDVWSMSTEPTPFAHFATMPMSIAERCVLAGTSDRGACRECGAPHERDAAVSGERTADLQAERGESAYAAAYGENHQALNYAGGHRERPRTRAHRGWRPTCGCRPRVTEPAVVLDPFAGSGTTLLAAKKHGRDFVGVELNPDYAALARGRLGQARAEEPVGGETLPLFAREGIR